MCVNQPNENSTYINPQNPVQSTSQISTIGVVTYLVIQHKTIDTKYILLSARIPPMMEYFPQITTHQPGAQNVNPQWIRTTVSRHQLQLTFMSYQSIKHPLSSMLWLGWTASCSGYTDWPGGWVGILAEFGVSVSVNENKNKRHEKHCW